MFEGYEWAYLLIQSTTTSITSHPADLGNLSMKSIEISLHIVLGISSGINNPAGESANVLFLWQKGTPHNIF